MKQSNLLKAASQFGSGVPEIESLGDGLIHRTFKVSYTGNSDTVVLQCINARAFPQPENIINNYLFIYRHLQGQNSAIKIPALVQTHHHKYFWVDEDGKFWRATTYIQHSKSYPIPENDRYARNAAKCFGLLTNSLAGIDLSGLDVIIPHFHNLELRYEQFEEAITKATTIRLLRSTHLISELRQRKKLLGFYHESQNEVSFPTRVMHHDCKISNVLFDINSNEVLCPVDLDTMMAGKYFSDVGDMIRSMACKVDENSTSWESISINGEYYKAILNGYMEGIGDVLTQPEKDNIHYSGPLMIYMQSLRFVTDFLNNDIYYKTEYPEQNLNRALNQLILLEQLEDFLKDEYQLAIYS